ncbi:tyrosine-type recombinase/integrase [Solibacillus merdavium]|uniref:Site-specific integrase n=1 Tax=Solibacillus merdavium TaxID=2762218 RepID=A0ABR8XLW4_9BACL|nr:site-specific integrase [Solibacillus merdavium]MBD8032920.1 site-specific integrase [Solibacillus merdavium]
MKDPIKEKVHKKTGKVTYEFAINLGVRPGEDKPFKTRRRGFKTKKAAWAEYMLLKARAAKGLFPERKKTILQSNIECISKKNTITENSTVAEYFPLYWDSYLAKGNASTTHDKTLNYFKNHILPYFGTVALKDLTPLMCKTFATQLINSLRSARQILIYFKSFLKDLTNMKLLKENPMEHVSIPTKTSVNRQKQIAGEEDVFFANYYTLGELKEFLSFSKMHCPQMKNMFFVLLAHTGLRRGEAIALRWDDIDFDKKIIRVNKSAAYSNEKKLHIKETKNYLSRKVNIDDGTLSELKHWKTLQQQQLKMKNQYVKSNNQQYIFQNKFNDLTNPSQTGRWLKELYSKCNIKNITVHGLRHTHCTVGLQSRAYSVEEMMHRLGHSDVKVTMQVYTHVTEETMERNPGIYIKYINCYV